MRVVIQMVGSTSGKNDGWKRMGKCYHVGAKSEKWSQWMRSAAFDLCHALTDLNLHFHLIVAMIELLCSLLYLCP